MAKVDGLGEGSEGVERGNEFVGDEAAKVGCGDSTHNAVPLDFLDGVKFMAAGNSAGVEVADPIDVFLDGADEIAFHDLHVVDVVQELDAGGIDGLNDLDAPGGVVAHIVSVVGVSFEKKNENGL